MRANIANREADDPRPLPRALSGSRPTRMEMKMMLSMPRTHLSIDSVSSVIQAFGIG